MLGRRDGGDTTTTAIIKQAAGTHVFMNLWSLDGKRLHELRCSRFWKLVQPLRTVSAAQPVRSTGKLGKSRLPPTWQKRDTWGISPLSRRGRVNSCCGDPRKGDGGGPR